MRAIGIKQCSNESGMKPYLITLKPQNFKYVEGFTAIIPAILNLFLRLNDF